MTSTFFDNYESITIGTGNVLEDEEFKKAKTPSQEVNELYQLALIRYILTLLLTIDVLDVDLYFVTNQ
jgi:hypothetical protein